MNIVEPVYDWAWALSKRSVTTHLIIHHAAATSETVEDIHRYHRSKGWAGIAYNYYVRKDGTIYRGRPENMIGGHTSNWNWCSIGVCFEGNFESEFMTDAQLEAGQELIADIRSRYPGIIVGKHGEYNATACPGTNFPFTMMVNPVTGSPEDDGDVEKDIPSAWAAEDWDWAKVQGFFIGGTAPQSNLTREQAAAILHRFAKKYNLVEA